MRSLAADPEGRASARPKIRWNVSPEKRTCGSTSLRANEDAVRGHPIHVSPIEAHNRSIIVFVTTCAAKRRPILASSSSHDAVVAAWQAAATWLVGRYVIMPDHIHLFCAPNAIDASSLERWMRYWKSVATRKMGRKSGNVWQRHHWDRQLRSGESYEEKWEYVRNNPVRHGYVSKADDWPYQGELNELRW
jgi:REP-associated tyrosine transposase